MRQSESSHYRGLTLRVMGRSGPALGPGKVELIARIQQTGSISAAARAMGMSYRRAWQLVESLNHAFTQPVVTTAVGGARGGGATVTPFGRRLVSRYRAMQRTASAAIATELRRFESLLRPRSGRGRRG
jgi:molybdate transport system regulatory protein